MIEIDFPIDFVVEGTPVSFQAKRKKSKREWKARIRDASKLALPEDHFASKDRIAVTLFYFPDVPMPGDIDNIVKLILDALCQHIYHDDAQVDRVVVQKFDPGTVFQFKAPSAALGDALSRNRPVLYVRLSNNPFEELV